MKINLETGKIECESEKDAELLLKSSMAWYNARMIVSLPQPGPLQLRVGGRYRGRGGQIIVINRLTADDRKDLYPWMNSEGCTYMDNGRHDNRSLNESDLIEEVL